MELFLSLLGGLISRWHGGGFSRAESSQNVVWAALFAAAAFLFTGNIPLSIVALGLCIAGKAIAHGIYIDLGRWKGGRGIGTTSRD